MVRPGRRARQIVKAAGCAALLCTLAFAQTSKSASATSKSAKKATQKSASTARHSSSSLKHSASSKPQSKAHTISHQGKGKKSRKSYRRGQQKIDSSRTVQIQQALIKQHYLKGEASGRWDAATEEALRRYQGDNGWQNKTVPDSRALIKLGLGPSHDHLLNPESAMTTAPDPRSPGTGKSAGSSDPAPMPSQPN